MQRRNEAKYQRLVADAEALFIQKGYRAVTMDEIAAVADISKMTVYKYFESKEALFLHTLNRLAERNRERLIAEIDAAKTTQEKLDIMTRFGIENAKKSSIEVYQDIVNNKYFLDVLMEQKRSIITELLTRILSDGITSGEVRPIDVNFVAQLINATFAGMEGSYNDYCSTQEGIEEFTKKIWDFFKFGLLGTNA